MTANALTYYVSPSDGLIRRGIAAEAWTPILNEVFDDWTSGSSTTPPSTSYWNSQMGMGTGVGGGGTTNLKNTRLLDLGGGAKSLRFVLPANGVPSDKGTTMWCQFPSTQLEAILEYDVRFGINSSDFSPWGWGGKLPGLGGVDMVAGTSPGKPSGGNGPTISDGWSGRLMWIGRAANGTSSYNTQLGSRPNRGLLYTYGYDGVGQYGDNRWFDTSTTATGSWVAGTWHHMLVQYRMNSLGVADGYLLAQIDGVTVYETATWMPRGVNANVRISHLWMHCFRGGDTTEWSVATEEYVDIDNLVITIPPGAP